MAKEPYMPPTIRELTGGERDLAAALLERRRRDPDAPGVLDAGPTSKLCQSCGGDASGGALVNFVPACAACYERARADHADNCSDPECADLRALREEVPK